MYQHKTWTPSPALGRAAGPSGRDWIYFPPGRDSEAQPEAEPLRHRRRTEKQARVEAVLLVSEGAVSSRKLAQFALLVDAAEARQLVEELNAIYDQSRSAFRIERVSTGYCLLTRPIFVSWLDKLHQRQAGLKLSPPAMETLTIVAYRQPITRADIESLRGVQCAEMLKQLMDRGLVRINGHEESLGRPYLYETTRLFLENFGLKTLADLPGAGELRRDPAA